MNKTIRYARGATRPDLNLWVYDDDGSLIDFTTGFSFVVRIGDLGYAAQKEKTTGIIGSAGTGNEDTEGSEPNVRVQWAAGDLDITPGEYTFQLNADAGGGTTPRYFFRDIEITDIVLAPA
jgi:hypothetical protein